MVTAGLLKYDLIMGIAKPSPYRTTFQYLDPSRLILVEQQGERERVVEQTPGTFFVTDALDGAGFVRRHWTTPFVVRKNPLSGIYRLYNFFCNCGL